MLGDRLHGLGRVVLSMADQMSRLEPDLRLTLLGDSQWACHLAATRDNVRVVPVASHPFSLSEQWAMPLALWRTRPQLLHAPSAALPLIRPVPYVVTIPDLIPLLFYGEQLRYRLYFRHWLPWVAQRARRILAFSDASRNDMVMHLGLKPEDVAVIPLGVDERFHAQAEPHEAERLRARYNIGLPYLLTAGNPKAYKNLPRALQLLDELLPALEPEMTVVVLSAQGPLLQQAVSKFSNHARLRHIAYVEEEDLPALYRQAHAFFYPSRYEGFGLQVLEAMACGTVLVSSSASSLPEVVGDGGLLVDVSDTSLTRDMLLAACTDGALRTKLHAKALERATHFSWVDTAQSVLQVYRAALR